MDAGNDANYIDGKTLLQTFGLLKFYLWNEKNYFHRYFVHGFMLVEHIVVPSLMNIKTVLTVSIGISWSRWCFVYKLIKIYSKPSITHSHVPLLYT